MSRRRHEVQSYSKIEMETVVDRDGDGGGGSTREEGLTEEDQHREEGLANGNTAASKREEKCQEDFKKRECKTFIPVEDSSRNGRCQCGRPRDRHATNIVHTVSTVDTVWTTELHTSEHPTDAFGRFKQRGTKWNAIPFLRLSSDTEPSSVYDLITRKTLEAGWCLGQPNLVVSLVGGEGSAEVKSWVQKVIRQGLVKALDKAGKAWILTEGFDEGVGRCVGEEVRDTCISAVGITPWGFVHNREQLVSQERGFASPARYSVRNTTRSLGNPGISYKRNTTSDSCCLGKNHAGFLLVDDGREGLKGGEKIFRVKFEEHLSTQHIRERSSITIPVLCMLISGELSILERVELSLKNATPWLVLAGSGGVADLLSDILENQSPGSTGVDVCRVTEMVNKHFPSDDRRDQLVEQVQSICQNKKLITFYHEDQERTEDFDIVMIKALMLASKHRASGNTFPYGRELFLAMRWDRLDFASSELFNDDININWKDEAFEDFMMFALVNNKPKFVRLFTEKNFNIPEYVTYGLLEKLYSAVGEDTLVYRLLLECLSERLGTSHSLKEISLFEVSGVLKKFMGDVKPFYFNVLGLEDITSGKQALERAKELLKEHKYRIKPCKSAWTHLFIWAVLQNHSDWADFFWEMVKHLMLKAEEPVLNALSAFKMLREMSTMEHKTETKLSMEKLSRKFEELAHDVLGSCYQSDEDNSFDLLNGESPVWGTNCVQMAMAAESLLFFNHDGLDSSVSGVWWGPMKRDTSVWKFLLTFFCPLLLYTNLITFKDRDADELRGVKCLHYWIYFWRAPITTFMSNAVMYFVFLFLFAYMLLVDFKPPPPIGPSISECVLYFWVFTFLGEEIRQAFSVGYKYMTFCQRMRLYWQDFWNKCDLIGIILFIIGLICRMFESSYEFGRGVLCIDYMVFTLRLIHICAIHKEMGPKIIIVGKMMKDVAFFLFFLGVWLMAYGVANQALLYSYDPNLSRLFRRVFYTPYLYIFGEFNLEEILNVTQKWDMDQQCTRNMTLIDDGDEPCRSEYNNWLVMILLGFFLLVTNILLINLLIAILSNTFNKVEEKSLIYWRFQHYNLVVEYKSRPALAPPFIILSLVIFLVYPKCHGDDPCGVGSVEEDTAGEVQEWESYQKKTFLKAQRETERSSDSERIKQISDDVQKQLTESKDIDQRILQISDKVDNVLKQLSEATVNIDQRQRALETKVENALGEILALLKPRPTPTQIRTTPIKPYR